jgi:hypothetical protein
VDYLVEQVKDGRYGTTQATILSLKALTKYMKDFTGLNGDGSFALTVNRQFAQKQSFTKDTKDAISFDIRDFIRNNSDLFQPGEDVTFEISLEDFNLSSDAMDDFKVSYSMNLEYYDKEPPKGNSSLGYRIQTNFANDSLGDPEKNGDVFSYKLQVYNKRVDEGLLMVVAIFYVPSCLCVNFDLLDQLKASKAIDYYEVTDSNTQVVLYWRQLRPEEQKTITLDFMQCFSGQCYQKPNKAYVYYNDDQPYWVPYYEVW